MQKSRAGFYCSLVILEILSPIEIRYFTQMIRNNPDWTFAGTYLDEGISGLLFRNTVDSLPAIRNLKADGAAVYFDKEYIKKTDG